MRALLVLISCVLMFHGLEAQDAPVAGNECYAGYGLLTDMRILFETENFLGVIVGAQYADVKGTGAFVAGYNRYLSKKVAVGATVNYQYLRMTGVYLSGEPINNDQSFLNVMARFDYRYVNNEKVQLYSGVSLGPAFIIGNWQNNEGEEDHFAPFIAYQINLIGMRVGKEWAGFGELGFGRNGLLTLGISRRF
jgi:hypothetical protein